ncbi:MAG TPA: iron ABC transporter permease [Candidatus Acetothermia bacterium]|nr:iron ABC transporter permease [Candidatus Acetothermia bacterium]
MKRKRTYSRRLVFAVLLVLMVLTFLAGVVVGPVHIPISDALSYLLRRGISADGSPSVFYLIISQIRLPRVLLGLLVGCALAISGGTMQGLFRNPLASPYVLGIASGASTGAALVMLMNLHGVFFLPLGAFVGGALAVGIIYRLAQERGKKTSVYTLILAGVAVGALFSAVTSFIIFLSSGTERMTDLIFWIMGGLVRANWTYVCVLFPIVAFGSLVLMAFSRDLNALAVGEEGAFHLGINPEMSKRVMLSVVTLLTSSAVAFAGTIGFVGLIIPHIMRLIMGPDHRFLLPATAIAGAIFLVWADMAARTVVRPAELPVGIITAFLGAPFFLYLLKAKKARM